MAGTDLIIVTPDGQIRVVGKQAQDVLRARPGEYRLLLGLSGMMVLCQDTSGRGDDQGDRVLLAGEVVSSGTVVEVINMIAAQKWRGQLQILASDSHRVLLFDQGVLTYASSTDPADRLDHVILRQGLLTEEQLAMVAADLDGSRRFGEVLLERRLIDHEKLFKCLQLQVQQIFFAALMISKGRFLFSVPANQSFLPPVTVHLPVDSLLLDGVSRIDEMSLYRKRIPHGTARPRITGPVGGAASDPMEARILELCNGGRSITEIAHRTGIDEFECTRIVYHLLEQGTAEIEVEPRVEEAAVRCLVERFGAILSEIFDATRESGKLVQTLELVDAWLQSGYASYLQGVLDREGRLRVDRVLTLLAAERIPDPLRSLHQALHELASFALFATSSVLPHETEPSVLRSIPHQLAEIVT